MRSLLASRRWLLVSIAALMAIPPLLIAARPPGLMDKADHRHEPSQRQIDPETSCGPASLAVVSGFLNQPGTIAKFHRTTNAGELGVCSMKDLLNSARERGLAATAVRYDPRRSPLHRLPMILYVDGYHFLAALPGRDGELVLVDPPSKTTSAPWSSLDGRWRGEAVVIGRSESEIRKGLADH